MSDRGGGGEKNSQAGEPVDNTSSEFNQLGTESSVSLASVQGVEHHCPTIRMPSGHRGRSRRIRRRSSGGQKIQTTPTNDCKYYWAQ